MSQGMKLTTNVHLGSRLRKGGARPLWPQHARCEQGQIYLFLLQIQFCNTKRDHAFPLQAKSPVSLTNVELPAWPLCCNYSLSPQTPLSKSTSLRSFISDLLHFEARSKNSVKRPVASSSPSVRPSVRMEQPCCHRTDCHDISYLSIFQKCGKK